MAKISVIVPVYNVEAYLKRCVDSILGQTYSDFELILVDDGSPDNCPQICDEYAEKDSRIRVIHQQNGGLSAARNAGIDWVFQNSNSEWFSFIDSDDYVHPRYLEVLLNAAEYFGASISVGEYKEFSEERTDEGGEIGEAQVFSPEDLYVQKHSIIACAKLYSRTSFEHIRYPIGKLHEDEFTTYKILFNEKIIAYIETPLYFYYRNSLSITKQKWIPQRLDAIDAVHEQLLFFKKNGFMKAFHWACKHYLVYMTVQIEEIGDTYESEKKNLCQRLRKAIIIYGKDAKVNSYKDLWLYWNSFPERRLYYRIKNKLLHIITACFKKINRFT